MAPWPSRACVWPPFFSPRWMRLPGAFLAFIDFPATKSGWAHLPGHAPAPLPPFPQEKVVSDVLLADQPIKRFVKAEEIGAMVRHLCTQEAAAITGACLSVDGGWTAR